MITSVSLNPSVDKMLTVDEFAYGGLNRAASTRDDLAGKAINVALVTAALGVETECIGFMFRDNGKPFEAKMMRHGIRSDFIWLDGSVRTNIKLFDKATGRITEINEPGTRVFESNTKKLLDLIARHAADSDYLLLTGSLPPGCPDDLYKTIIGMVEGLNCRCVLDASGEALKSGILARPFLIKPNIHELQSLVGRALNSVEDIVFAASGIVKEGVEVVCVSMGEEGALIVNRREALYAKRVEVNVRSTVGAGDAMVGGLIAGFLGEQPLEAVFRMGVACASASVMADGTKAIDRENYKLLFPKIQIVGVK